MNDWTFSSSSSLPASKPRESWKTKRSLLLNEISCSISCSPRYNMPSETLVCGRHGKPHPQGSLHIGIDLKRSVSLSTTKQRWSNLSTIPITNNRRFGRLANSLEECGFPSIGPSDNEDTKLRELLSNGSGAVRHDSDRVDTTERSCRGLVGRWREKKPDSACCRDAFTCPSPLLAREMIWTPLSKRIMNGVPSSIYLDTCWP